MFSTLCFSQNTDTLKVDINGNTIYHIQKTGNTKILIFLHGGVNNPKFDNSNETFGIDFLLEGNKSFIPLAVENGFDLVIPVTNDSMNWLTNHMYCYRNLLNYVNSYKNYDSLYISGFSDGGTGAFKIFYDFPSNFQGLAVFNGYPQHKNFYKKVNYEQINHKIIAFFSTFQDKTIPYEFLLTEYCEQKKTNANTYLYIKEGIHSFKAYNKEDINLFLQILTSKINNTETKPIHGYIENDELKAFYHFRKKICKKFGFGKEYYLKNKEQAKHYKK